MSAKLNHARVLVVGGSSGIGLATAAAAVEAGAAVTIASRSQTKLESAVSTLGKTARAVALDTGDVAAVERFFADEAPWDHIVVSAAQTPSGPVRSLSLADAKIAMESKFWGAYRVARREDPRGRIADFRLGLPERSALCELGVAGRN